MRVSAPLKRTILQIIPRLDSGGAERTTVEVASAIARIGGCPLVASHGGRLAPEIESIGGELILMPVHSKNPFVMALNVERLVKLIRRRGVDLIHVRSRAPAWSALAAARRTGVSFVTTYHGAYGAAGPLKRWYNSAMVRSDCVIANSRFTGEAILRGFDIAPSRLKVVPRGADLELFDPMSVSSERIDQLMATWNLGSPPHGLRVLLPGRLTSWKGHSVAIDAAYRLKSHKNAGNDGGLTVVFCGAAQGRLNSADRQGFADKLRLETERLGVRDEVHLVGDCTDMPAAYAWADVVIAPSTRPEAFGRIAVEAGAMGKPVIVADHGASRETVVDGETGILVLPGDGGDLAEAIGRIWSMSADERAVMGANGRARVARIYSAARMCEATLDIYREIITDKELVKA